MPNKFELGTKFVTFTAGIAAISFLCYLDDEAGRRAFAEEHPGEKPKIIPGTPQVIDCGRKCLSKEPIVHPQRNPFQSLVTAIQGLKTAIHV